MLMMKFHTFYTTDLPDYVYEYHKSLHDEQKINVEYHCVNLQEDERYKNHELPGYAAHGDMIDEIMQKADDDEVVCFLDIDCYITRPFVARSVFNTVKNQKIFAGNAQNISHNFLRNHVYAAASCFMIHKHAWTALGSPSLKYYELTEYEDVFVDTCMELSMRANDLGYPYMLIQPTGFDMMPSMNMGPLGIYGKGTHYPFSWHLGRVSDIEKDYKHQNLLIKTYLNVKCGELIFPTYSSNKLFTDNVPYN
jgi:hypothetical protein